MNETGAKHRGHHTTCGIERHGKVAFELWHFPCRDLAPPAEIDDSDLTRVRDVDIRLPTGRIDLEAFWMTGQADRDGHRATYRVNDRQSATAIADDDVAIA